MPPKRASKKRAIQYDVSALGALQLVVLSKLRNSPLMLNKLMGMKIPDLVEHVQTLGPARLSEEEALAIEKQLDAISEIASRNIEDIKLALSSNNISTQGATSREKLALVLYNAGDPPIRSIELDPHQEGAVKSATEQKFQMLYAGPGAGKTTTLCGLAIRAAKSGMRVVVLAYNRNARKVMLSRLPALGEKKLLISVNKAKDPGNKGVCVLTFDQYVYHFRVAPLLNGSVFEVSGRDVYHVKSASREASAAMSGGYTKAFHFGLSRPIAPNEHWDMVIVDEAQDVKPEHEELIAQLTRVSSHVVAAGDARQELYSGATWFSRLIAQARGEEEGAPRLLELSYNHRSSPNMIAAINAFSRVLFPTLHYDQRPPGAQDGWDAGFTPENGFGGAVEWVLGGPRSGELIAEHLMQYHPRDTILLTPVSLEKWKNSVTIKSMMQHIYDSGCDRMVLKLGKGVVLDDFAYFVGTARTAKGTERDHVVVFAPEKKYLGILSHAALCKMLFVCLTRARKTLKIVLDGPVNEEFPLAPLVPPELVKKSDPKGDPSSTRGDSSVIKLPPRFSEWDVDLATKEFWDNGLPSRVVDQAILNVRATGAGTALSIEVDERYANDEEARVHVPDKFVVDSVIKASVAAQMGFDLTRISPKPRPAMHDERGVPSERVGVCSTPFSDEFEIVYDSFKVKTPKGMSREEAKQLFEQQLVEFLRENAEENPAFTHVILDISASIGTMWTMSNRLRSLNLLAQCAPWAAFVDSYIRGHDESGSDENTRFKPNMVMKIRPHRSTQIVGSLISGIDFMNSRVTSGGQVVSLVYEDKIERDHIIEASIQATITQLANEQNPSNAAGALVVNLKDSTCTEVRTLAPKELNDRVRALYAFYAACYARNKRERKGLTRNLPHLAKAMAGLPVIVVDIETGKRSPFEEAVITEIGAVCFSFSSQNKLIDTFHRLGEGVIEVSKDVDPDDLIDEGDDLLEDEGDADVDGGEFMDEGEEEETAAAPNWGTGAGTPDDPWIPFAPAGLGVTSVGALRGDQYRMCAEFRKWVTKCAPAGALIVQWAGSDARKLEADSIPGISVVDAHHAYKWYLESTGQRRVTATTLGHAVLHLLGPDIPFAPHRAFDDAVMTASVLIAMQNEGNVV